MLIMVILYNGKTWRIMFIHGDFNGETWRIMFIHGDFNGETMIIL